MEPILLSDTELAEETTDEETLIHAWRVEQLCRLGLQRILAEAFAAQPALLSHRRDHR